MSKEVLLVVESVSNEKGVPANVIFEALELALATATKKRFEDEVDLRVEINRHTGAYETFRRWTVVEEADLDDPAIETWPSKVAETHPGAKVGDVVEEKIESIEFGRIAAQTAKQVIVQKVREAERDRQFVVGHLGNVEHPVRHLEQAGARVWLGGLLVVVGVNIFTFRSASAEQPIFSAMERMAAHCVSYSPCGPIAEISISSATVAKRLPSVVACAATLWERPAITVVSCSTASRARRVRVATARSRARSRQARASCRCISTPAPRVTRGSRPA